MKLFLRMYVRSVPYQTYNDWPYGPLIFLDYYNFSPFGLNFSAIMVWFFSLQRLMYIVFLIVSHLSVWLKELVSSCFPSNIGL